VIKLDSSDTDSDDSDTTDNDENKNKKEVLRDENGNVIKKLKSKRNFRQAGLV